mgnify:CR=1 FL=1
MMCLICNKIDNENNFTNQKCLQCYENYKKAELNRNKLDPKIKILSDCKASAKARKINWNLEDNYAFELFNKNCTYCDKIIGFNGIDRIDSNKDYSKDNCVSCCKNCNIIKGSKPVTDFILTVKYILIINGLMIKNTYQIKKDYDS